MVVSCPGERGTRSYHGAFGRQGDTAEPNQEASSLAYEAFGDCCAHRRPWGPAPCIDRDSLPGM